MTPYLQTERLALRPFSPDDAELLIELDSDPAVMRHLSGGEATAPELVHERDLPSILRGYERWNGNFGVFAAYERDSGAFIGWFHLRPDTDGPQDEAELGFRLRQDAWGKGYATEGSNALLDKAFSILEVRMVWGATMSVNRASQKVMEKVGMTVAEAIPTPEDMRMVEGAEQGGFLYRILREQWEQQPSRGRDRRRD